MSTIASLLALADPNIKPWSEGVQSVTQAQTGLRNLADLKAKQQAEALVIERIKNDPEVARQLFAGGPVLGSLQQPQAPPGAGPMTQQTVMPGQSPGAPQAVPGGMDLSRFATQGAPGSQNPRGFAPEGVQPPQSTIASLGPAGQPQMQAPRNPVLEMAQRDPRAAMMLQQQIEGRQDAAMKRQEQNLKLGAATLGYVGQQAQGVTDQASLDALRSDLQSQGLGKYAAQLPQIYSKEAMQPFIAKAVDVEKSLTLQVQDLQAQAAVIKARKEGRSVDVDNQLRAMGVQPGQETPAQIKEALRLVQEGKIAVSASHGQGQLRDSPLGVVRVGKDDKVEYVRGPNGEILQPKPTAAEQTTATFANLARKGHDGAVSLEDKGFKPGFWEKAADKLPLDMGNYLTSDDYQKYKDHVTDFAQAWLRETSKGAITEEEWNLVNKRYFPQPGNSKAQIEQKRLAREQVIKELEDVGKGTGRTGTQAQPQSQSSTGTGGQAPATSQGPATFDPADFLKWRQGAGKTGNPTQADVEAYFQAKGLKRR